MGCGNHREALLGRLQVARPTYPEPPQQSSSQPPAKMMRLIVRPSIGAILTDWSIKYLNAGHPRALIRIKAFASWTIRLPLRGWRLALTLIGPRVSLDDFEKRMTACSDCQAMQIRLIRKAPFTKSYCGSCGCPRWPLSELQHKNHLLKWICPQNKHDRLDDPPAWQKIIEHEKEWANAKQEGYDGNA